MKTYWQQFIGTAVLGLALCVNNLPAWAGYQNRVEVSINRNTLKGTFTGARYSADSQQYLTCVTRGYLLYGGGHEVVCYAQTSSGAYFECWSTDPRFVDAVKGLTDSSYITVTKDNNPLGPDKCVSLEIDNGSNWLR